jgi:tetratricopeptide (TPR) repeat protein
MPNLRPEAVLAQVAASVSQGDLVGAWRHMEALAAERERDPEVAAAWLALLRNSPDRPTLVEETRSLLERFPSDLPLVTRACDALIRAAEQRPPDEPRLAEGPARLAAETAERALSIDDASQPELKAFLHMAAGNARRLLREHDAALAHMQAAIALAPERGGFWFNLGLLHKARLAFAEALEANERALELLSAQARAAGHGDKHDKGTLWNIAICATALGRGDAAVGALRALGHAAQLSASGMPFVEGLPPVQVRVATVGSGHGDAEVPDRSVGFELLWITPLSPVHGVVSSASYRVASVDYGDVVLWDAVPIGIAEVEGRPVPRFPLLAVMYKGDEHRFRFVALQQKAGDIALFEKALPASCKLFVHEERIEQLCVRCASGEHMQKHKHSAPEAHRLAYGKIVVERQTDLPALRKELDAIVHKQPAVQLVMPGLFEAIGDSAAAGKAHQLWRGLERLS